MRWLSLLLLAVLGCNGEHKTLNGVGSSFVDPMMQEWAQIYYEQNGVAVNYQAKGSSAGIKMMTDKDVDFGCSDAPFNDEQLAAARQNGTMVHIPLCIGAVVPAYHLPVDLDLVFSGQVLLDIYLGNITRWDDDAIKALNPTVAEKLPPTKIAVAYRSDGSGTTYVWTEYLTTINQDAWTPGCGTSVKFPAGTGSKGNEGVASFVKETVGAIGYIELSYALKDHIAFGSILNRAGKPIRANIASMTAAATAVAIPDDLRYSIIDAPGAAVYPVACMVWAVAYVQLPAEKARRLVDFLTWVTHDGQQYCAQLDYAQLPEKIVRKIETKLKLIETAQLR